MIKTIRKLTSTFCTAMTVFCVVALVSQSTSEPMVAQTQSTSQFPTDSMSMMAQVEPEWRYTRLGWQDANDWATVGKIERPPERRFDNLHPIVLAMLILFSVLVSVFWASNEWELAQFEMLKRESDD